MTDATTANLSIFIDSLSLRVVRRLTAQPSKADKRKARRSAGRKNAIKPLKDVPGAANSADLAEEDAAAELAEFVEYLATELFESFPPDLQALDYAAVRKDDALAAAYSDPLPSATLERIVAGVAPSTTDSMTTYGLLPDAGELGRFLEPALAAYVAGASAAPPAAQPGVRASACEICCRDWIPLTYHHLIPRDVHDKAVRRGWHAEWALQNVAWLCRACHSFVHGAASNEELAQHWHTVDLLLEREDVVRWAKWVSRVRWKAR